MSFGVLLLILLGSLTLASSAFALEITYPTLPGGITLSEKPQLNEFVRYIYAFSIFIAGFVALGVTIFGGFLYLLSGENPVKRASAREWIGAGFWGMLILLMSYIILTTINPQLVGLKEVTIEPTAVPPYDVSTRTPLPEQKDIGFQIPMGKLIEQGMLDSQETKTQLSWATTEDDTQLRKEMKKTIQKIIDGTNKLNPDLFELKQLIDSCNCGGSQCSDKCAPQSCTVDCDFRAIQAKAEEIKNSPVLSKLEEEEEKSAEMRGEVKKRNLNLYRAVFLTTIFFDEVRDYFSFAIERETVATIPDRKIEIETLPEWKDIKLSIKTSDGRVIPDPATFYFWKAYKEMEDAISFASAGLGGDYTMSCPGTSIPPEVICTPSQPGAMVWPAQGTVTTKFKEEGPWRSGSHEGIDIANTLGTPIVAAAKGRVIAVNTGCIPGNIDCGGRYGNWVLIEHENFDPNIGTIYTMYAHLEEVRVSVNDSVEQGQQIGTMGWTGWVEPLSEAGTHLHFEVRKDREGNNPIDPMTYLTGESICGPGGSGGGGTCEVITDPNNPCSVEKLRPYFGAKAEEASQICNAEGAKPFTYIKSACKDGGYDYSVGPFQINLYRTCRCPGAWVDSNDPNWCEKEKALPVTTCPWPPYNENALDQCAKNYGLGNADLHYRRAAEIFHDWGNWCAWSTACPLYCNLCSDWSRCP